MKRSDAQVGCWFPSYSANGEIEILDAFWVADELHQADDIAPPLVVYADLMATADPRNIETANLIRDKYLA